jgi:serine protease Do
MKKQSGLFILAIFAGLLIGLLIGIRWDFFTLVEGQHSVDSPSATSSSFTMEDAVVNVANTAGEAVVSISAEHVTKIGGPRSFRFHGPFGQDSPFGEDDLFRRFFDDFFGQIPEREYKQLGLGSGVIIDEEGYILTNEHVVSNAEKIVVTLPDGREFKGEIKGKDARSDLAVIKINARGLPVATLGDSDELKIGEWVVAIGNPFGFALQDAEPTVTAGVVSALHRSLGRAIARNKDLGDLIQTDAAINPGNSGGPLVNLKGEVVGINVAIFSTSGGYQGIGFAIPVNNAKRIISRLIAGKKILYGWLGVTVQDLTDDLAKYFGLADKNGVLIAKVLDASPAQKAGMKDADVIKKFDNKSVNNVRELLTIVGRAEVGRKVKVDLVRDKKPLTLKVVIGERPEDIEALQAQGEGVVTAGWRGLEVEDLTRNNQRKFGIREAQGALIVSVESGSPGDDAGLVAGDVILEINKRAVKNSAGFQKITRGLKGNVLVRVTRGFFLVKEKQ